MAAPFWLAGWPTGWLVRLRGRRFPCPVTEPPATAESTEAPPPPQPELPAWLQRKVLVAVRDVNTRQDMTFQLLEDVRCLMTFEVRCTESKYG